MKVSVRTVLILTSLFALGVPTTIFWLWSHSALQNGSQITFAVLFTGQVLITLIGLRIIGRGARRIKRVAIATLQVAQGLSDVWVEEGHSFLRLLELDYLENGFNRMASEIAKARATEAARAADLEKAHAAEAVRMSDFETANQTLRDEIAERKLVQAMLKTSEARFRNLFESEPIAIREEDFSQVRAEIDSVLGIKDDKAFLAFLEKNPRFVKACAKIIAVIDANTATTKLYGVKNRFQISASVTGYINNENSKIMKEIMLAIYRGETRLEFEAIVKAANVKDRVVMVCWSVATGYEKTYGRVLITSIDITERKVAEERLKQAQKMEAVGQLTGGVAHDFNNLLAVIAGNAELLAEAPGVNVALTNSINRAVRRGAELTQRLLAFSRRQPLRPKVVDLGDLVTNMSELLTRTLDKTIEFKTIGTQNLWEALADAGQVENALLNLAINARDAMPDGGKLIVECSNVQLENAQFADDSDALTGDFVVLSVNDNGVGMTADVLARASEPFFTTKEVGKGSGLGLSMVYGFAKQSGGNISVKSEPGKGTTVWLFLPRAARAKQVENFDRPNEDVPLGRGEIILVIEDDTEVRFLATKVLTNLGYRVVDVPDAAGARKVLAANEPVDIVLSDVILPGDMSGPQFAEEARAARPGLKVIFMSGYSAEAAASNGFLKSDCVLLSKPFERRELATALRHQLDLKAA